LRAPTPSARLFSDLYAASPPLRSLYVFEEVPVWDCRKPCWLLAADCRNPLAAASYLVEPSLDSGLPVLVEVAVGDDVVVLHHLSTGGREQGVSPLLGLWDGVPCPRGKHLPSRSESCGQFGTWSPPNASAVGGRENWWSLRQSSRLTWTHYAPSPPTVVGQNAGFSQPIRICHSFGLAKTNGQSKPVVGRNMIAMHCQVLNTSSTWRWRHERHERSRLR
jgi:hypothetical protein